MPEPAPPPGMRRLNCSWLLWPWSWRVTVKAAMSAKVDLYNNAYGNYERNVYRDVRVATYGEDLGQTSWVTQDEANQIPKLLELTADSRMLEIGCGSGRYALRVAGQAGCKVLGLDVNANGIANANELARAKKLHSLVLFEQCDVSQQLSFEDKTFDAVFANDVLCHLPGRPGVLGEIFRILKPGGRLLFSDALVIGGMISQEEIAARSSIGYYVFSPPGENERLLRGAGFRLIHVTDTSNDAAAIAQRWFEARQGRKPELVEIEGEANFEGLQRFLACVHTLTLERRLLRCVYLAAKDLDEQPR
jgi:SAM-dependent methyltransferase